MFQRVLENLVGNALKHHHEPENAQVTITATEHNGRYTVSIADNGTGIDPTYHDKIFDMFQNLSSTKTTDSTGVGIAIVKKAIECNRGQISVRSSPGNGTTFNFDWPAQRNARTSITRRETV